MVVQSGDIYGYRLICVLQGGLKNVLKMYLMYLQQPISI
jgi:hypothetical protein